MARIIRFKWRSPLSCKVPKLPVWSAETGFKLIDPFHCSSFGQPVMLPLKHGPIIFSMKYFPSAILRWKRGGEGGHNFPLRENFESVRNLGGRGRRDHCVQDRPTYCALRPLGVLEKPFDQERSVPRSSRR